jgi:hypothetical protein
LIRAARIFSSRERVSGLPSIATETRPAERAVFGREAKMERIRVPAVGITNWSFLTTDRAGLRAAHAKHQTVIVAAIGQSIACGTVRKSRISHNHVDPISSIA